MPATTWNKFVIKYPQSPAFMARVSATLGNARRFDNSKKKLPTPYGLLKEWIEKNFTGDWTSTVEKGVVCIRVATPQDVSLLTARFPIRGPAGKTPAANVTYRISYADYDYPTLAREVGYNI
ncbi:hypothetical protein [Azospirillum sp. Sh1]|uniref:hypothetical protein n=1 Tax=Azospirillum sp. Sh1 TaxID=2607285 RepID=UPI0011EDE9B7|nr:hypothetical protein [Azospirillum sp. Sh1]KAA0570135.1 hypothetical protein FZ029_31610 [Azospirillum sp. Sh1]